jgi:hypothetical protein
MMKTTTRIIDTLVEYMCDENCNPSLSIAYILAFLC